MIIVALLFQVVNKLDNSNMIDYQFLGKISSPKIMFSFYTRKRIYVFFQTGYHLSITAT
jgi:hypothetical protein